MDVELAHVNVLPGALHEVREQREPSGMAQQHRRPRVLDPPELAVLARGRVTPLSAHAGVTSSASAVVSRRTRERSLQKPAEPVAGLDLGGDGCHAQPAATPGRKPPPRRSASGARRRPAGDRVRRCEQSDGRNEPGRSRRAPDAQSRSRTRCTRRPAGAPRDILPLAAWPASLRTAPPHPATQACRRRHAARSFSWRPAVAQACPARTVLDEDQALHVPAPCDRAAIRYTMPGGTIRRRERRHPCARCPAEIGCNRVTHGA